MTDVVYDVAIDMSNSEAFAQGFADTEDSIIYLVFKNGSHVSRRPHPEYLTRAIALADEGGTWSWGTYWHNYLKYADLGPDVSSGVTFVPRSEQEDEPEETFEPTRAGSYTEAVAEDILDELNTRHDIDLGLEYDLEFSDFVDIVQYVLANNPDETDTEPEADEQEPQGNSERASGTFVGLGYLGVSDEDRERIVGLLNATQNFISTLVPAAKPLLETYNVDDVRKLFGRFL